MDSGIFSGKAPLLNTDIILPISDRCELGLVLAGGKTLHAKCGVFTSNRNQT